MRKIIIYQCSECGKTSSEYDKILNCELQHLGLTRDDYLKWSQLRKQVERAGHIVGHTKNPQTDKAFDDAIKALIDFEKTHNLCADTFPVLE